MNTKSAFITGGSSGIGYSIARAIRDLGYSVTITGRDSGRLAAAVERLGGSAAEVVGAIVDAADWAATRSAVDGHVARFGGLDLAIANAGFTTAGDFVDGDPAHWEAMILTNLLGPALLLKGSAKALIHSGGQFIVLGSVAGRTHRAGSMYGATKHAVAALAENARLQFTHLGVRVAVVEPGMIDTDFWGANLAPAFALDADAVAQAVAWLVQRPAQIDINDLVIRPVGQPI